MEILDFIWRSIPMLLQLYADLFLKTDAEKTMIELEAEHNVPITQTYDFIVVGAGSAGCAVAARLSEMFEVLLLESGGTPPPAVNVPFLTPLIRTHPAVTHTFRSVPQTNASLCCGGIINSPRGNMLGGSSSVNSMIHNRGSPKDFDNWANILDDDSFSYENVLRFFRKMENFVGERFGPEGDEYYGDNGPIVVRTNIVPILPKWFDVAKELGYEKLDPNGLQREGFMPYNMAIKNGRRSSSYTGYIEPYEESRSTLTVIRYANVSQILLDNGNRAYGVAYTRHGIPQVAYARKEVILSAGAYSSPLLLMKSGIGPESILNAAGIPVKVPIEAVGKNLVDHPSMSVGRFTVNDSSIHPESDNPTEDYHNGYGVLAKVGDLTPNEQGGWRESTSGVQCVIVSSIAEANWPDLHITVSTYANVDGTEHGMTFSNLLGRPFSKGEITMDTEKFRAGVRDDVQLALIDFKFLTDPEDMQAMLDGIRFIFKIVESNVFRSINTSLAVGPNPACNNHVFLSDDYWRCRAQHNTINLHHPVGTCSMGPDSANSSTSVVDTKFRVRGVSNLRIVDASVHPVITNVNINAAVVMLAEKAAEEIINYHTSSTASSKTRTTMLTYIVSLTILFTSFNKLTFC